MRRASRSGQTLVEFGLVSFMTIIMLLFVVEMGRVMLLYTAVAGAARAGVRYAIVHGSRRGSGGAAVDNSSGPGNNPAQVVLAVRTFATTAPLTGSRLVTAVTYPGASNAPGQIVKITVSYPYDPLTTYFFTGVSFASTSQGVIVF